MVDLERLNALLKEKHMSKRMLERKAGLGVGTTVKWKTISPTTQNLQKVANVLGMTTGYLTGESEFKTEQDALIHRWNQEMSADLPDEIRRIEAGVRIPVLGEIPCGIPIEAIEFCDVEEWEEISETMSRQGRFFALKVKGDSMSPRIQAGDILIVLSVPDAESGDIVIVRINGQDACCKKLIKQQGGIVLQSFNPAYHPMFFTEQQVQELPVEIIGKVVENRQKF